MAKFALSRGRPLHDFPKMNRRTFCGVAGASLVGFPSLVRAASRRRNAKVAVIGADGMDPTLLHAYAKAGLLPNCRKLLDAGGFTKLRTTLPPQSPVAWATFVSGLDPGGHGIYDFITRDPATLAPELSTARTVPPRNYVQLGKYSVPLSSGRLELCRQGPALWDVLQEAGVPSVALKAPVNYPPSPTKAKTLCGLTTPDIHGSYGIFSFYTTDPEQTSRQVGGGQIERIRLARNLAHCELRGPENAFIQDHLPVMIPFTVERDTTNPVARVRIQGRDVLLQQGEWSDFLTVQFSLLPYVAEVYGICRFYLKQVRPQLELYVTPINIDPVNPAFPISTPASFSREIARDIGQFYTQGMAEETASLSSGVFTDAEFRQHALYALDQDIRLFRSQLNDFDDGFFFAYFSALDMNSHMFWRTIDRAHPLYTPELEREHGDHLPSLYQRIDQFVGEVVEHLGPKGHIYVCSDHAFTSFRRQFNLNSWLLDNGYSTLVDPLDRETAANFANTDWTQTEAYGLGINSIYLNLAGREPNGVVKPGSDADAIVDELTERLTEVRDPQTGAQVIRRVVQPKRVYRGVSGPHVPDLVVCYADTYRASWDTILGGYPADHVTDNLDPWSGDHCMDPDFLSGVLLTNTPVRIADPAIEDLAPTIIRSFGVRTPEVMKGRNLQTPA